MNANLRWVAVGTALLVSHACAAPRKTPAQVPLRRVVDSRSEIAPDLREAAEKAALAKDWRRAAALYGRIAAENPSLGDAHRDHAIALEHLGDASAALEAYRRAAENQRGDLSVQSRRVQILIEQGRYDEAATLLAQTLDSEPGQVGLIVLRAKLWRRQGHPKRAVRTARRALMQDQSHVEALRVLALSYMDLGSFGTAETLIRNAIESATKKASLYTDLGLILFRADDLQGALQAFEEALREEPENSIAHANIGAIALRYRDYARARAHYERALEGGAATQCSVRAALGHALIGLSEGRRALRHFSAAFAHCPKHHHLLVTMGKVCMEQLRDPSCALQHFRTYLQRYPDLSKDHAVRRHIRSLQRRMNKKQRSKLLGGPDSDPPRLPEPGLHVRLARSGAMR